MTTTAYIVIAAIAIFLIYCRFLADNNCSAKHSPVIVTIFCRLVSKHMKLAWKLMFAVIYFILTLYAIFRMQPNSSPKAPETHLGDFADRITTPIQLVADGFLQILGILALLVCFGLVKVKDIVIAHGTATL